MRKCDVIDLLALVEDMRYKLLRIEAVVKLAAMTVKDERLERPTRKSDVPLVHMPFEGRRGRGRR